MPEKPEVITVVNSLEKRILGKTIKKADVYWDNIIEYPGVDDFRKYIKNQTITELSCRGKWIVITLTDYLLLIHLRMEGKFFFRDKEEERNKHEHVVFTLDDNVEWRFHDVRKFGKMLLIEKDIAWKRKPLIELGLEYDDKSLDGTYLYKKLSTKTIPIKTSLLDQSIIAGIGNIYDDEILFSSHILPTTSSNKITKKQCDDIIKATREILSRAVAMGGTTIRSYSPEEGVHGLFQNELSIHGKKICPKCKNSVEKIFINKRGTYFCKNCQK